MINDIWVLNKNFRVWNQSSLVLKNLMGILPPGGEENNTFKQVGLICLQEKHREMTEMSVSRRLRDMIHKEESWV